jgi:hypothetical protein
LQLLGLEVEVTIIALYFNQLYIGGGGLHPMDYLGIFSITKMLITHNKKR